METVSKAFKTELNCGNRRYIKSCDITLSDGTVLHIGNAHIWSNGFKVDDDVSGSGSFDIGAAIIGKFTLVLNNIYDDFSGYDFTDAIISNVKVGLKLPDDTVESVKKGVFAVDEPTYNGSIITLECLDNMSKFDRPYSESKLIYPATLGAIVRDACSCCGVSLAADSVAFDGCDIVIPERPDGDDSYTFRQVLSWAGQISCHWCRCNENGELSLGWYDTEQYEKLSQICDGGTFNPWSEGDAVDGGTLNPWSAGDALDGGAFKDFNKYHHIYSISSRTVSTDDVVITGVRVVKESSEGDNTVYQSGTEGYVLSIEENRFIQGDMGSTVAASLGEKLIGLRFRPLSVSCLSDPSIEAGDIAAVSDRKGNTYFTLITSTTFQAGNYQKVSCDAETPSRNSASRFSKATQVYRELRRNLSKQKTEWEKAVDDLGKRMDNAGGLYPTEEKQDDGSTIYYFHDKPTLAESKVVFKMTNQAIAISTDGGKTWPTGVTVDGVAVAKILNTIGVNASWINSGALTVKDADGNIIFLADMDTKRIIISGDHVQIGGKSATSAIDDVLSESKGYSDQKVADYADTVSKTLDSLQAQVDGQVEDWYYDYEPTMQNEPASGWTTTEERTKHIGDRFLWKSKGYAYRFMEDNGVWGWVLLQDTDITKAMQAAADAQQTADGKIRNFVTTPSPPYDIGDNWSQDGGDVMVCTTARTSGSQYVSSDWRKLNKYTDDTVANEALAEAKKARNLAIILDNEYQGIPTDHDGNYTTFPTVQTYVQTWYGQTDVSASCSYSIQKSDGVTGSWDSTTRVYTVTALSTDAGWVDITASYLDILTVTKRFTVAKIKSGASGRTYFMEASSIVAKRNSDGSASPKYIRFSAFYRDGTEAERTGFAGRFKIQKTTNGGTWKTIYTSSKDEYLVDLYFVAEGEVVEGTDDPQYSTGTTSITLTDEVSIRCTLYAEGGTTQALDMQGVAIVKDVDTLTHEEIFNILTNNGAVKGIYKEGDQLYISFTYAKGGDLTLGGSDNSFGRLIVLTESGKKSIITDKRGTLYGYDLDNTSNEVTYIGVEGIALSDGWDGSIFPGVANPKCGVAFYKELTNGVSRRITYVVGEKAIHLKLSGSGKDVLKATDDETNLYNTLNCQKPPKLNNLEHVSSGGNLVFASDGATLAYLDASSKRYKDIDRPMTDEDVEDMYNLPVVWAKYKDGRLSKDDERCGKLMPMFIAEDVDGVFPLAADHKNGQVEDWNYRIMIPLMFQMLKAQKHEIEELKKKLEQ